MGEAPDGPTENMVAIRGSGAPHFGFAGHLDVVPPGDGWDSDPFDAGHRGRRPDRPRRQRHEERDRRLRRRGRRVPQDKRHPLPADHRRRGRLCHLRHAADHRLAQRARHPPRHDPDRRADLGRPAWRYDQDRPARLGQHVDRRSGHAGPCRLPAPRRQSDAQAGAGHCGARRASSRRRHRRLPAVEPGIHRHFDADPRQQRHPGLGHGAAQHPLQQSPAGRRPGRSWSRKSPSARRPARPSAPAFPARPSSPRRASSTTSSSRRSARKPASSRSCRPAAARRTGAS